MSANESLQLQINDLRNQIAAITSNSVQPKDGEEVTSTTTNALIAVQSGSNPVQFIQALTLVKLMLTSLGMVEVNQDPPIGAFTFGEKAGINDGVFFIGKVQGSSPPTTDSHIDFKFQL